MELYLAIFLTLIAALFTSYSQFLFKKGLTKKLNSIMDIIKTLMNKTILLGLCGYTVSFLLYLYALSGSQLSVVFPIFASSFIFVTIISSYKLKEPISLIRIAGILIIFLGIVIVAITA